MNFQLLIVLLTAIVGITAFPRLQNDWGVARGHSLKNIPNCSPELDPSIPCNFQTGAIRPGLNRNRRDCRSGMFDDGYACADVVPECSPAIDPRSSCKLPSDPVALQAWNEHRDRYFSSLPYCDTITTPTTCVYRKQPVTAANVKG